MLKLLRAARPDVVYLPHAGDGSFDHQQAHRLVWRALEMSGSRNFATAGTAHWVGTVLGYEVPAPIASPSYIEDIDQVAGLKLRSLACYGSQDKGPGQAEHHRPGGLIRRCPIRRGSGTTASAGGVQGWVADPSAADARLAIGARVSL